MNYMKWSSKEPDKNIIGKIGTLGFKYIEIPGYVVYNKTSNYYLRQNILGNNFYFYCNEEEKKYNKKIAPKIFYDTQGAMRALKYDNKHHEKDEYEIKQVSLHYIIEE